LYDPKECAKSENTKWEVERARSLGKEPVLIDPSEKNDDSLGRLKSIYEFSEEFDGCFPESVQRGELLDIYRIMLGTSEQLINRRQVASGFFLTIIGAFLAAAGYLYDDMGANKAFSTVALAGSLLLALICRSWHNLLVNYGRLNKAKFRVLSKMEAMLGIRAFDAEWLALGKGVRKNKYQSFTATEAFVPRVLMWFFVAMSFFLLATSLSHIVSIVMDVQRGYSPDSAAR
jgi:hypothetical protein